MFFTDFTHNMSPTRTAFQILLLTFVAFTVSGKFHLYNCKMLIKMFAVHLRKASRCIYHLMNTDDSHCKGRKSVAINGYYMFKKK